MSLSLSFEQLKQDVDAHWAGLGLRSFPLMYKPLGGKEPEHWWMGPAEQIVSMALLQSLRPKVAIEIGTLYGGFLTMLAHFAEKVYSIDIDPDVPKRLAGKFSNVEYVTGNSIDVLPPLLEKLCDEELGFVLIDGDHSTEGVRRDIDMVLQYKPNSRMIVLMHDSMNPAVRAGLRAANWASNPFVQLVELDLVVGIRTIVKHLYGECWEGLAIAELGPKPRVGDLVVTARAELLHRDAAAAFARQRSTALPSRVVRKMLKLMSAHGT
jgi:hypothetical protein